MYAAVVVVVVMSEMLSSLSPSSSWREVSRLDDDRRARYSVSGGRVPRIERENVVFLRGDGCFVFGCISKLIMCQLCKYVINKVCVGNDVCLYV